MRRGRLEVSHDWVDLLGANLDDARAFIAKIGAPYPQRLGEAPVVLAGRRSGVSVLAKPRSDGHYIERIAFELATSAKPPKGLSLPADVPVGARRDTVHARLGPPAVRRGAVEVWSVDGLKYLSVTYQGDVAVGAAVGFAD